MSAVKAFLADANIPEISAVVTIVDGGDTLRRFLDAITHQDGAPSIEVVVAWDSSIPDTEAIEREYPDCIFVPLGHVKTECSTATAAGQHELYDARRTMGVHRARGTIVAIMEDRAPPRPEWARQVACLHATLPWNVIGGAIECAPGSMLNWAFYVCDLSRYGLPFTSGPRQWVSDINVSYKRAVLERHRDVWQHRFVEATVHWKLMECGETLFLSSDMIVDYRTPYTSLLAVLPERFHWGRLFGFVRAVHLSPVMRVAYTLLGPVIPLRLLVRHARSQFRLGHRARFLRAAPTIAALLVAWTTGEVWGYITRKA